MPNLFSDICCQFIFEVSLLVAFRNTQFTVLLGWIPVHIAPDLQMQYHVKDSLITKGKSVSGQKIFAPQNIPSINIEFKINEKKEN